MKNWVVLFGRTGSEEKIARILKKELNANDFLPFVLTKEVSRRKNGVFYAKRELLFPGYIFIQTEIEAGSIAKILRSALMNIILNSDFLSILHYGDDKNDVAMHDRERLYWERLLDSDFCVTGSMGFIEGDIIRVTSGPLVGMEGHIKLINRRKREAVVEMEIMGTVSKVGLMLEVVGKVK